MVVQMGVLNSATYCRPVRLMSSLVAMAMVLLATGDVRADTSDARRDSLYRDALAQVGKVRPEASIEAFEQVLKRDWKFAPAHYEIAKLYMEMNTPLTRQSARKALDEAMRLVPENNDYHLTLGELLSRQGFTYNADREYQTLAAADSGSAEAAYLAGYFAVQEYLALIDKVEFVRFDRYSMGTGNYDGIGNMQYESIGKAFYWKTFAMQSLKRARRFLNQSVEADPEFRGAYNLLGLLYVETGEPEALVLLFKRFLQHKPEDKDAYMFCGLGYQMLGEMDVAHIYYRRALERMSGDERSMMESVDVLASKDERTRMAQAITYGDTGGAYWTSDRLDRFWRRQDPLFLTAFNERKMEHYGRVAYANLRFTRHFKEIDGWQTDPGKAFIKFGRYSGRDVFTSRKVWYYGEFRIWYENGDGLDAWRFARGSNSGRSARQSTANYRVPVRRGWVYITRMRDDLGDFYSGESRRERLRGTRPHARHVFRDTPQRYIDPYRDRKYQMPFQVAAFQERDSIRVEFAYAIPKARVRLSDPNGFVDLEDGVFLFDERWEEVYRRKMDVTTRWPDFDRVTETVRDSLRRNHIVSFRSLRVAPRQHRLVVEVRDRGTGSIGTFREFREFDADDSSLAMSDLLLASGIEPKTAFPEGREDLRVTPNPIHTYGRSEPVYIYLEIYNLKRDRFGGTKYRISYRLTRPDREEIRPERFAALDAPGAGAAVEIQTIVEEAIIESEEDLWRDEPEETVSYRVKYILPERNRISEEIRDTPRKQDGAETTVTAQYRGNQEDDFTFLQIDAANAPAGFHKLIVTLKDLYTGRTAKRDVVFRVVE